MQRPSWGAAAAALLLLAAASVASEDRVTLAGDSHRSVASTAEFRRAATPAGYPVTLTFALKRPAGARDELRRLHAAVSDPSSRRFRQYLSLQEVNKLSQPVAGAVDTVSGFLQAHHVGPEAWRLSGNGDYLLAEVPVGTAEAMLATTFEAYHHVNGRIALQRAAAYSLPASVAAVVDFVSGVQGLPFAFSSAAAKAGLRERPRPRAASAPASGSAAAAAAVPAGSEPLVVIPVGWRGSVTALMAMLRCADGSAAGADGSCARGPSIRSVEVRLTPVRAADGEGASFSIARNNLATYCQPCDTFNAPSTFRGVRLSRACGQLDLDGAFRAANQTVSGCFFPLQRAPTGANATLSVAVSYEDGSGAAGAACPRGLTADSCGPEVVPQPDVTPAYMRSLYGVPEGEKGAGGAFGNRQAVAEFLEEYYNVIDLAAYVSAFGVDAPAREHALVCGGSGGIVEADAAGGGDRRVATACNDPASPGGEATLDVQVMVGVAPDVPMEYWSFGGRRDDAQAPSLYNQEPFLAYMLELNGRPDGRNGLIDAPLVHSFSYDDEERQMPADFMDRCDDEFVKAGLRGVSLLFAAGDDGAGGSAVRNITGDPSACDAFHANWPSSSPFVTSVGGTATGRAADGRASQVASASRAGARITTGGGFSDGHYEAPDYQRRFVERYLAAARLPSAALFNAGGRAYPDLSAVATHFMVALGANGGGFSPIGGTSASTPLVSALFAMMNDRRLARGLAPLGFLNPALYALAYTCEDCFHDVTEGDNACSASMPPQCCAEGFHAAEGWDAVSGLGTPNYTALLRALEEEPRPAPSGRAALGAFSILGIVVGALAGAAAIAYAAYVVYENQRGGYSALRGAG